MSLSVIIVAAGSGKRMNSDIPKQFLDLKGKPILFYSIEKFAKFSFVEQIFLVLNKNYFDLWNELISKHNFQIPHIIVEGGSERFHSVKNALNLVKTDFVAIHDGVRPFVADRVVKEGFEAVKKYKSAVPAISAISSIRIVEGHKNYAIDRSKVKIIQTPQFFDTELLKIAYKKDFQTLFTDDASVFETLGYSVYLYEGNRENIKITTPFDLKVAKIIENNF